MSLRIARTPQADLDLLDIFTHIAVDSPARARQFLSAARSTFEFLTHAPRAGRIFPAVNPQLRALRLWPVSGFRSILIVYIPERTRLTIVRVLHGARDLDTILNET